jgi:arginine-tRNA-protein transferase
MEANYLEDFKEGILNRATPEQMDMLLADAWRHFGATFFRNRLDVHPDGKSLIAIVPLRINLEKFTFSKHHLKLLRREKNTIIQYQPIVIDAERETMFQKHILRFNHNIPEKLSNFLGDEPGISPCLALECALYDENKKLYAVSYFDIANNCLSSIYATFDTNFSKKSPGLHTLLAEIMFAIEHQKQYVYLGYAHDIASHYDYKKQFNGLEFYDWEGNWLDYGKQILL